MFATPTKQSVGDTIVTLAGRLSSSTLLEDRRAAILGLRSFAKEFPASVASDALRGLIESLRKDGEDVDTVKIVLETLLMLFNPNENSPEASQEIALWLADEFTQRQDNITLLLNFLDTERTTDFYSRLYSLQLLSAILASRAERTEECIFTAPLGIPNLVAVLDDKREAVRNEGLSLLTYLTPNSAELQKLVAFENAFDRIFTIIHLEGSLSQGDRVVEDCLILLANLLRLNASNQQFFREAGNSVPKLAKLLGDALTEQDGEPEVAEWAKVQRNRNIYALLAVLRLCLVTGGVGTPSNQVKFCQYGILDKTLELAFSRSIEVQIKAEALITCADLIRGNQSIQEHFPQSNVISVLDEPPEDGVQARNGVPKVFVIDGLLDLMLSVPSLAAFDSRLAACECIKAYFFNHAGIRKHFLRRAIDGHSSGADETGNVLTTLLQPVDGHVSADPYRYWFAAVLMFHLIFDDHEAKTVAMSVAEGDASSGEEVVTCIQNITSNLITGIQKNVDERVLVAYIMLLSGWLFEDPDAVNDFLGEGSNVQSLVQAILQGTGDGTIVQGLCALLLGIVYEFSTKDSPVPRKTIHDVLVSRLGRDQYVDRFTKLRNHPLLRDYEVLTQTLNSAPAGSLPNVFFDKSFVDFVKDNFSRLLRAIDRDPGFEIPVVANGVQKGISREMVDSLRSQLEEKEKSLQKAEEELLSKGRQLGQEQADHRRAKESSAVELSRTKSVNEALQRTHDDELNKLRVEQSRIIENHKRELDHLRRTSEANVERMKKRAEADKVELQTTAEADAERTKKRMEAEMADLQNTVSKLESDLRKANKDHVQDLQTAHEEFTTINTDLNARLQRAEEKSKDFENRSNAANEKAAKAEGLLAEKENERKAVQGELDDMLMVFGDLEEKTEKYKQRLKELGENVSDGEDEEEEAADDDDDDDDID